MDTRVLELICSVAPAKLILLGEHFVVMDKPAIATAINLYARVCIEENDRFVVISEELGEKIYLDNQGIPEKYSQFKLITELVASKTNKYRKFKATISSAIPPSSGLGSSAATAVAFIHALYRFYGVNPSLDEVNSVAFEAEKVVHGKPSGVDNTVSTYGGLIYYKKGLVKRLDINWPDDLNLVVVDTGVKRNTGVVVRNVLKLYGSDDVFIDIYGVAEKIVDKAWRALEKGDFDKLPVLINVNHGLLVSINVSTVETEYAIHKLREAGALASKISGAGMGGVVYGLFKGSIDYNILDQFFKSRGFKYYVVKPVNRGVFPSDSS
ncbi:MAG: mevalonate kinase [Desulfurococcaceae archaeon]